MFQGAQWKEALKILKLVVTRSSTLVAPPTSMHGSSWDSSLSSPHPSFTDTEIFTKKELPGKSTSPFKLIIAYLLFLNVYYRFCFSFLCDAACMHGTDDLLHNTQVAIRTIIVIDNFVLK